MGSIASLAPEATVNPATHPASPSPTTRLLLVGSSVDIDMLSGAGVAGCAVLLLASQSGLARDLVRLSCVASLLQHVLSRRWDDAEEE